MQIVKDVGEDVWSKIEDCRFIYPMVIRVVEGDLTVKEVMNEILKGETD